MKTISDLLLPLLILLLLLAAGWKGLDALEGFIRGARQGMEVAVRVLPNLAGMLCAIALMRESGLLGLGNAATPSGMEAVRRMEEEQEQNPQVRHALYMLLILNATGLQLFPTTVLTLRVAAGSAQPNAILLPTLACTALSTLAGAGLGLLCYRLSRRREERP